jgi:hypothetical protein
MTEKGDLLEGEIEGLNKINIKIDINAFYHKRRNTSFDELNKEINRL